MLFRDQVQAQAQAQAQAQQPVEDKLVRRYRLYAELLANGSNADAEFVRSVVKASEVAQVIRLVAPSDPLAQALSYLVEAGCEDAVKRLINDYQARAPDWLKPILSLIR